MSRHLILGSRSPRRLDLLRTILPNARVTVLPPSSAAEAGFDGPDAWQDIERRLREIARAKCDDVLGQLRADPSPKDAGPTVVTADTIVVATDEAGATAVLGQPPERPDWRSVVRQWFARYYLGRTHIVASAVCVAVPDGRRLERVVTTRVTFAANAAPLVDWYLATDEPLGKAGGYALQGAGSVFVERVEGSLSNVVGLPLRELLELLHELDRHPA